MNQHLKQRLVGATVLVVLGIIVLPMILDKPVSLESEPEVTNIELPYSTVEKKPERTQIIPEEVIARYERPEDKQAPPTTQQEEKPAMVNQDKEKISSPEIKPVISPKVQPEKPPEKTKGSKQWVVQMGSFSSKENADRLVQRLKAQKFLAYFEGVDSNGRVVYRVRVGPFDTKSKTEEMKQKLDQKENLKTLIVTLH